MPASNVATLGDEIQTNIALQYHLMKVFWPEFEVNWTYYVDGQRGGLNQVFLTPGLVLGRFQMADGILFTTGLRISDRGGAELPSQPANPGLQQRLGVHLPLQFLKSPLPRPMAMRFRAVDAFPVLVKNASRINHGQRFCALISSYGT